MKSIILRCATVFAVVAVAMLSIFNVAQAQDGYAPYNPTNPYQPVNPSPPVQHAPALAYEGPYATAPNQTVLTGAFGFGDAVVEPVAAHADDGTGGALAVTGTTASFPIAIGVALVASGATAVVAGRKRSA